MPLLDLISGRIAPLFIAAMATAADKSQYNLLNPTPVELRRAFNTDRPSKTDSPFTVDAGVFQIETDAVNWTVDRDNIRVRTATVGQSNFKLGLTNWLDFQLIAQGYVDRRASGAELAAPMDREGIGDTTLRVKMNLRGNDGGKLVLGLVASLKLPTNSDRLGNSVYEPGIGLPINLSLPGGITFFGQTRLDLLDRAGSGRRRVLWSNPVGLSRTLIGKLSGYAEFYSAISSGDDYPWVGTLDAGLIYQFAPNCSVDINAFYGLTDSADDLNVFTGFAYRF